MSTYISAKNNYKFNIDEIDAPHYIKEFLYYLQSIENLAPRTVCTYYLQITSFLRWFKARGRNFTQEQLSELSVMDVQLEDLLRIKQSDILEFLSFATYKMDNVAESRALKLTAIRKFYKFQLLNNRMEHDPTAEITSPKMEKRLPKYLTIEQSERLLNSIKGEFPERDFCIITLFLNCGMRLSELSGMNLADIQDDQIRIFGKGRKERMVYLNDACQVAIRDYLEARQGISKIVDKNAMWISKRTGKRLSNRRIEQMVDEQMRAAGLGAYGFTPHKLRHTAATLIYQSGAGTLLEIKEILGHENTTTTELYTHLNEELLRKAIQNAPLADFQKGGRTDIEEHLADELKDKQEGADANAS